MTLQLMLEAEQAALTQWLLLPDFSCAASICADLSCRVR